MLRVKARSYLAMRVWEGARRFMASTTADEEVVSQLSPTLASNEMVQQKRKAGQHVFHLGFGQSPFPIPTRLCNALGEASHLGQYLKAKGDPSLVAASLEYYSQQYKVDLTSSYDVLVAPGSKLLLYALQLAIPGDLILPVPSWSGNVVSYKPQALMLKSTVIPLPTKLAGNYVLDPTRLRETIDEAVAQGLNPTKIILNSPNNPTGLVIERGNMLELAQVCQEKGVTLIADEIYGLVTFDHENHYSALEFGLPNVVVTTGLSKHLSCGGWRLGLAFVPNENTQLMDKLQMISSELWSAVPTPISYASVEAYKHHPDVEAHIQKCTLIHSVVTRWCARQLENSGLTCPTPQGGFYVYPNFENYRARLAKAGIHTSTDLALSLLNHANVATLASTVFGMAESELCLRLALCDYDGTNALAHADEYNLTDPADMHRYVQTLAPNLVSAMSAIESFVADLPSSKM